MRKVSSPRSSNYSDGAMFLNERDLVEVTLQLDHNSFVLCSVKPTPDDISETSPRDQMTQMESSKLKLARNESSSTQRALGGLRFITESDTNNHLWAKVETRFNALAKDGLLNREDFGECIGNAQFTTPCVVNSK